ncbi:hypothetical protein BOX15_Mlig010530g1 [Macrostomum lignano]|uniref:Mitochondrial import inner membrane translocase subunit TIM50 n=1 Tax=Macrostomum lignano TaxID=282301 RepID=A0A267DF36_9PLAT|nr:hypothetical protein BOX15_Mlig010530g1 [Macrostomum lignano]
MSQQQRVIESNYFDHWCREVSRQPYRQFLRHRPHYRRLRAEYRETVTPPLAPLLKHKPPDRLGSVTLLLDLEGTLLTSKRLTESGGDDWTGWEAMQKHHGADLILLLPETPVSFKRHKYVVYKRPGLDRFLLELDRLGFECVAYSSATLQLASCLVSQVDRDGIIASVLARKACTWTGPSAQPLLFKDIDAIGRDPARTVLIDDWPLGCSDSANLLQVPTFSTGSNEWQFGQSNAESTLSASAELPLNRLLTVLERLAEWTGDVRDFLSKADCVANYRSGLATAAAASN